MKPLLPWSAAALVLCGAISSAAAPPPEEHDPELGPLLQRLARTAELFRDTSLNFACTEKIHWRSGGEPGDVTFEYVFVYDEEGGFQDYRTVPFHGKRRKAPPAVSPDEFDVPWFLRSAYLWVFVFRDSRQALHRYRILGEEEVLGIRAVMIEFEPIPPIQAKVNDWFGIAWVDPALGQLLKVVALEPDDYETRRRFDDTSRAEIVDEVSAEYGTVTTLFSEERNGLRFPGKVTLEQARYRWRKKPEEVKRAYERSGGRSLIREPPKGLVRRNVLLRVEQTYGNYQFFSVRTASEVKDYILHPTATPD